MGANRVELLLSRPKARVRHPGTPGHQREGAIGAWTYISISPSSPGLARAPPSGPFPATGWAPSQLALPPARLGHVSKLRSGAKSLSAGSSPIGRWSTTVVRPGPSPAAASLYRSCGDRGAAGSGPWTRASSASESSHTPRGRGEDGGGQEGRLAVGWVGLGF